MVKPFAFLEIRILQGTLEYIKEIELFETLEEAKVYLAREGGNFKNQVTTGWGSYEYQLARFEDGEYNALEGEKPIGFGTFFAGPTPIIKK